MRGEHRLRRHILKVLILLITSTLCSQTWGEAGSRYKPLPGVLLIEMSEGAEKIALPSEPGRFASLNTIVIDPGHGGKDAGAIGPTGLEEKDVTLKVAAALKKLLQSGLGSQVFLTRGEDRELPPEQRAGIANNLKADLFISLHAAASPQKDTQRIEIFLPGTLSNIPSTGPTPRRSSRRPGDEVIRWETAHLKYLPMSRALGKLIQLNLSQETDDEVIVRELPMLTLRGANMPSLLIEIGYITNPSTETDLKSGAYIDRIASAIFRGIKQYRETLSPK